MLYNIYKNYLFIYNIIKMDKQNDTVEEETNEKEIQEMLENCTKVMNMNIQFKNKEDKYIFDRLPISAEDKIQLLNEILSEQKNNNADNLKI
jgi:F0F1-type ATP synthase delta subunit